MPEPGPITRETLSGPLAIPSTSEDVIDALVYPRVLGYEIQDVLGRGGMGVVYKACQLSLNRPVALKMLLAGAHAAAAAQARFQREAEAIARLTHPNVVRIYEVGTHAGVPFFSMELVEGGTHADRLREGPLRPRAAAAVFSPDSRLLASVGFESLTRPVLRVWDDRPLPTGGTGPSR